MKKIQIAPQQLGEALFIIAFKNANDNLKNKEIIKTLNIKKIKHGHLLREMTVINMFAIIQALEGLLKNESLENTILDSMHEAYYKELVKQLNLNQKQITNERLYVLVRYEEYQKAMKEKGGPNWLWPLTNHMLNNLRGEETRDAFAMLCLTTLFSALIKILPNVISKYEIMEG